MRLLLDTHVLIWFLAKPEKLPPSVVQAIVASDNQVFVSVITAWEIAVKRRLGKLEFDADFLAAFDERVAGLGYEPMSLTAAHVVRGIELDSPHKDPFDRLLAGQALVEGLTMVTADAAMRSIGVPLMWRD